MYDGFYLEHHGIKGQRWGIRRFQNKDGSLTPVGEKRYDIPDTKSNHRIALESKYLKDGMSKADAEQAAAKRIKVEKWIAAAAGVAVLAGAAYVTKQEIGKRYSGVLLKSGTTLTNINALGDQQNLDRRLYTSFLKGDTNKYKGMLGKALQNNKAGTTVFEQTLKATQDIKAPSQKEAAKLYNEFTKTVGLKNYTKHIPDYRVFNKDLVIESVDSKNFYDFMRSKGFNAILDANDQFISGYNSNKPLILFNAKSSTVETGRKIVEDKVIKRLNTIEMAKLYTKASAPNLFIGAATVASMGYTSEKNNMAQVNRYLKKHPNTEHSLPEIYAALSYDQYGFAKFNFK